MYNWSVDISHLKKFPERYLIWKLEQLVNFGLGKEKLDKSILKKYFHKLNLDPDKKMYLQFILKT